MPPIDKVRAAGAAFVRGRVKPVARRGLARVEPLDRVVTRAVARTRRSDRLAAMYEALRANLTPAIAASHGVPSDDDVAAVQRAAITTNNLYGAFFRIVCEDGDADRAAITLTRRLIANKQRGHARCIAQALHHHDGLRPVADLCLGLCAMGEPMPDTVWRSFNRPDLAFAMRFVGPDYFRFGFRWFPDEATAALTKVLDDGIPVDADAAAWVDIALGAFATSTDAGPGSPAARALDRADEVAAREPAARRKEASARTATLREWLGRADQPAAVPPGGQIPFALVGFRHPDRRAASTYLGDPIGSLAALGHLARRRSVTYAGDAGLAAAATRIAANVPDAQRIDGPPCVAALYEVDRDASAWAEVPDGTWTIVSDPVVTPVADARLDLPLDPRLRPVFVGFSCDVRTLAAPGAIDQLRRCEPIGCRDWDTVHLLQAAGVSAFHSGPVTATVNLVAEPPGRPEAGTTVFAGRPGDGGHLDTHLDLHDAQLRDGSLADGLAAARRTVAALGGADRVVTGDLVAYVTARTLGTAVDYRPDDVSSGIVDDLRRQPPDAFASTSDATSVKLAAVLDAILAGADEDTARAAWRAACADDVITAETRLHGAVEQPTLSFDLAEVCRLITDRSVTIERSQPAPDGTEINIEFSLDGNYKHQLDIVLDSIVRRCSRPVRAFVLCRQHGPDDFDRMARAFPTVSFVWLPTDDVDYGRISGMNRWVTPATMDRTVLPVLLPDVDRMLHFDLDAMSLSDVAELYDTDLRGNPIAASAEPQPRYLSGFETLRRSAVRLRREGRPDLADRLIVSTHARHRFDFDIFNAGIMVMDLQKMRDDDFCGRFLPYVQAYGLNGQVVLNTYVGHARVEVGPDWNRLVRLELPSESGEYPKIAHWAGPYKPWRRHFYVSLRDRWRDGERHFAERVATPTR